MRTLRRLLKWAGFAALALIAVALVPVVWIETQCVKPRRTDLAAYQPIVGKEHQRRFVDTFLTYPEWSIVHAYQDFAVVAKDEGDSSYRYLRAVRDYWRGLCTIYGEASAQGEIAPDMRAMLHIIGLSFSAEMLVKGNWENTVGLVSTVLSTDDDAAEDVYAHKIADDYAQFLVQTPWYEFPFGKALSGLWAQPITWDNPVRSMERRVALSLEWGGKSVYAKGMAALAGLAPADLKMRSVVTGLTEDDLRQEPSITLIERRADGGAIIETPRYRAFTELMKRLSLKGRDFVEIGGNDAIFVTMLASNEYRPPDYVRMVLKSVRQAGTWNRFGAVVPVSRIAEFIRLTDPQDSGVDFEHAYDF